MHAKSAPTYNLNIGEIIICSEPSIISTVLGSCVSVCLYSPSTKVGGMIHYAHPRMNSRFDQVGDYRYAEFALPTLIEEMENATGESHHQFVAKIIGGANEVEVGVKVSKYNIGSENIKLARQILKDSGIQIVGEDVGGTHGRKVLFHTSTHRLQVAKVNSTSTSDKAPTKPKSNGSAALEHKKIEPTPSAASAPVTPSIVAKSPQKRKVLVVDDSRVIRDLLKRILSEDPEMEIVGFASDANEAAQMVKKNKPDVITLDIHMPGMTGVEWLEKLLPQNPIPVVMISSLQLQEGNEVFRALELGAVDYIQKPSIAELPEVGPLIREKVKTASYAKVRTHKSSRRTAISTGDLDIGKVLAIGASTGGTEALKVVLLSLPERIPPTVIVQHIPPVFSKAFADRLNEMCSFEVKEAEDGDELLPSRVLIAPGAKQMKLQSTTKGLCVRITDDAPMNRHKPSVDYLFHSVASILGKKSVGVILTGMGADGAQGLLAMKNAGAKTIGQDENSSVVYGMPRAAYELGAVEKVAPLEDIAREIMLALPGRKAA